MAKIQLNGKKIIIKANYSILDLLKKYKLSNKKIAIEHNGLIVQKSNYKKKYLKNNDKIFIHSCDSLIEFETNNLKKDLDEYEGIIYTTKANKIHVKNIKSYGWVNLRKNKIFKISCKQKASSYPKKDLVIIGSFAFKNKKIFLKLIRKLIQSKQKINNEYYLDMVFKVAFENRHKIKNVKVKTYYSWGTPEELTNWIKKFEKKLLK